MSVYLYNYSVYNVHSDDLILTYSGSTNQIITIMRQNSINPALISWRNFKNLKTVQLCKTNSSEKLFLFVWQL